MSSGYAVSLGGEVVADGAVAARVRWQTAAVLRRALARATAHVRPTRKFPPPAKPLRGEALRQHLLSWLASHPPRGIPLGEPQK